MSTWTSPWWMGLTVDHLIETCPARQRSLPELRRVGWHRVGSGEIDVDGTDVCGWCRNVWQARRRKVA